MDYNLALQKIKDWINIQSFYFVSRETFMVKYNLKQNNYQYLHDYAIS